jgi:mannose-6-phosphate isomerase-like protein (cupin superfamily)
VADPGSWGLAFDVDETAERLRRNGGGYQVVHTSPGLEVGVYVLVAPNPDTQTPHRFDEVYLVLSGRSEVEIAGERREMTRGEAVFVPGGVAHRFLGYDELVLLVVFNGPETANERT